MNESGKSFNPAYHERNHGETNSGLLESVVEKLVPHGGKALDLGCSALRDTKFLLGKDFDVTAVDGDPETLKYSENINTEKLHHTISTFENFDFPAEEYDLVVAVNTLGFIQREKFDLVFARLKDSIKINGIIYCTFFGNNHAFVKNGRVLNFTEEQVKDLFDDFEIKLLKNEQFEETSLSGEAIHWHNISVVAERLR